MLGDNAQVLQRDVVDLCLIRSSEIDHLASSLHGLTGHMLQVDVRDFPDDVAFLGNGEDGAGTLVESGTCPFHVSCCPGQDLTIGFAVVLLTGLAAGYHPAFSVEERVYAVRREDGQVHDLDPVSG